MQVLHSLAAGGLRLNINVFKIGPAIVSVKTLISSQSQRSFPLKNHVIIHQNDLIHHIIYQPRTLGSCNKVGVSGCILDDPARHLNKYRHVNQKIKYMFGNSTTTDFKARTNYGEELIEQPLSAIIDYDEIETNPNML